MTVTFADVQRADRLIARYLRPTPVFPTTVQTVNGPRSVVFKLEQCQLSGTFKARGAFVTILELQARGALGPAGVAIASGGNAGIAAACAAKEFSVPATVFVPSNAPPAKVARLRALGAEVVDGGASHADTHVAVGEFVRRTGAALMHPYDIPSMVAGAGTLALELDRQVREHGPVLAAVGGGGLIAGICVVAAVGGWQPVAVEPKGAPTLHAALRAAARVRVDVDTIAADSLGAAQVGEIAFEICSAVQPMSVLVSDRQIDEARQVLWNDFRLLVENSAAASLAAIAAGAVPVDPAGPPPVLVLCGANVTGTP